MLTCRHADMASSFITLPNYASHRIILSLRPGPWHLLRSLPRQHGLIERLID
jgi:hypothetical protein